MWGIKKCSSLPRSPKSACRENEYTASSRHQPCANLLWGYGSRPLGCKIMLSRISVLKIITQLFHWPTLEHNCVHWPKKAGMLSSTHPSGSLGWPSTILCIQGWAASPGFQHPASWILPLFCPTVTTALTPSCAPIHIYVALLPFITLPLQAHGSCFSFPRIWGSLQVTDDPPCNLSPWGRATSACGWTTVRTKYIYMQQALIYSTTRNKHNSPSGWAYRKPIFVPNQNEQTIRRSPCVHRS